MKDHGRPFRAVILAGGQGRRLYPLTEALPKPLLQIDERPVIELIVRRLVHFGAGEITVAVGHLGDLIEGFLGSGEKFGVPINYVRESHPLGTAGSIGLVPTWEGPLVVTNGDVLSDIDFQDLLRSHCTLSAALSVATKLQTLSIDAGVITTNASMQVTGIVEKPRIEQRLSLGIYVISDHVRELIPANERIEMPEVIQKLISHNQLVAAYDHMGLWLDIGRPDDLARARADAAIWGKAVGGAHGETGL